MSTSEMSLALAVVKAIRPLNAEKTKLLMFYLGVPEYELDDIQSHYNVPSQKVQFVRKWIDFDVHASWEKLVSALKEMNMHRLALEIVSAHILKTPVVSVTGVLSISSPVSSDQESIEIVRVEIDHLEDKFFELKSDARASLSDKEKEDSKFLGTLRDFLLDLPVAKRVIHAKFFLKNEDEILEAKNSKKLFAILGRYCNYSNYEIIVLIIKKFGTVELKVRMLKYCDSIKKFEVTTTVAVYLKAISAVPDGEICKGFARMAMKINKPTTDCTLYEIRQLKAAIAENASVHSYSVYVESLAESSVLVVLRAHASCVQQVYAAITPEFTQLYYLMDVKHEMQIKTDSHLFGIEESGAEDCTMMPPLTPITVFNKATLPWLQVMVTEDDDQTGDSGLETGSGGAQFMFHLPPAGGYTSIRIEDVKVNHYTKVCDTLTKDEEKTGDSGIETGSGGAQFLMRKLRRASDCTNEAVNTGDSNRSVLMEVVGVLESQKVKEMELAHKVRKMLSDSTFPTPGGENGGEKYKISDIGRDGARRLLERSNCGTFLIRDGRTAECALVLSVKLQHRVCHYRIIKDSNSRYRDGSSRFDSLDELIDARKQTSSMHNDFKLGACVTYNL